MSSHRRDHIGELIEFARTHSPFYQRAYDNVPADATSVTQLPIINADDYWKANASEPNGVMTRPLVDATAMRSGGSTGTPKQVFMTKQELSTHGKVTANAMAQGCGFLPGDRVANMSFHGSLYGSFMLLNTALLELPVPIVHLPISGNESVDVMAHYMETLEATVLIANVSTTRRLAEYFASLGKTLPKLRLILYTGECFTKELRPVYRAAFPNATIYVREYGGIDFGHVGIPAQPFKHEDDDIKPVPITRPGIKGNVVVTSLLKRQQPLLRYPVGDIASWVDYDAETFRVHGRDAVGIKIATTHLPVAYLRELIERVLSPGVTTSGSQFVVRFVKGTHEQELVMRIVAPEPTNSSEILEAAEKILCEESPTWKKNRTVKNIAPLQIEWIDGHALATSSGKSISHTISSLCVDLHRFSATGGNNRYGDSGFSSNQAQWKAAFLCVARRLESNCTYHPAPMTRPSHLQTPRSARSSFSPENARTLVSPSCSIPSPSSGSCLPPTTQATLAIDVEFLGATAFSAIINDDLDVINSYVEKSDHSHLPLRGSQSPEQISEGRIHAGVTALSLLTNFPSFSDCIDRYLHLSYTCMVPDPFVRACVVSIQGALRGPVVSPARSRNIHLRNLALQLFANTSKPLDLFPSVPARDYHTLFTGPNLRWEIIGFVLALLGVSLKYDVNKRDQPSGASPSQPPHFVSRIAGAVEYCVSICHRYNCVSHQALWLLYGDACLKNLVCGDMTLSSVGPPRIPNLYCALNMPADIDDVHFLSDSDELDHALRRVDMNGWNADRQFRGATWRRIKLLLSQFREEVLGVCLGARLDNGNEAVVQVPAPDSASALRFDDDAHGAALQPVLAASEADPGGPVFTRAPLCHLPVSAWDDCTSSFALRPNLQHAARYVLKASKAKCQKILYYGLPAASILAVDLLKLTNRSSHHISGPPLADDVGPRAEIIQNLSVFVSNIQRSINRQEVNQEPCKWAHRVLSSILGRIIEAKQYEAAEAAPTEEASTEITVGSIQSSIASGFDVDGLNFDDFLQQIENGDWTRDISDIII
ncbi:hypothetical protein PG993_000042 [Apiospora rasikravindrae]|uniref:AMP-dependent synthetase/ligase domain-containing protein n=1 Tax=Apiospora rasikravindrae TaxID=990691 RepID=A0ABR1U9N4_9PEZI